MPRSYLLHYEDQIIFDFLQFGWPTGYALSVLLKSTPVNHSSALAFKDHVQHFLDTEIAYNTLTGPFDHNPLPHPLVCSPQQTVLKRDSDKCRVVMDLSFPPGASVNNGVV